MSPPGIHFLTRETEARERGSRSPKGQDQDWGQMMPRTKCLLSALWSLWQEVKGCGRGALLCPWLTDPPRASTTTRTQAPTSWPPAAAPTPLPASLPDAHSQCSHTRTHTHTRTRKHSDFHMCTLTCIHSPSHPRVPSQCPHTATQACTHTHTLANTFSHVFGFCSWARGGGCDLRSELRPGKQAQRPVCCLINTDGWGSGWSQTGREREQPEAEGMTQKWGWRGV